MVAEVEIEGSSRGAGPGDGTARDAERWGWALFAAAPSPTLVIDAAGRIVAANPRAEQVFATPLAALLGIALEELLAPECRHSLPLEKILRARVEGSAASGNRTDRGPHVCRDLRALGKGRQPFPVELTIGLIDGAAVPLVDSSARGARSVHAPAAVVVVRDVTEQQVTEQRHAALAGESRLARERLEALLEFAPAFIIGINTEGAIDFINRTLPQHSKQDVIGTSWLQYIPPERHVAMLACMRAMYETQSTQHYETSTPGPDGAAVWFESQIAPIRAGGRIAGAVIVSQDVTERKRAQAELLAGRHLALLGTLAAGVAHEINTPIQFVGNSIQFLRDAASDLLQLVGTLRDIRLTASQGAPAEQALEACARAEENVDLSFLRQNMPGAFDRCIEGLNRVATIVRSLKEFAHPPETLMKAVDLNHVIQSTLNIATNEYKYVARVETELGDLPPVVCHGGEISQTILNIIVNAAHAIGDVVNGTDQKGLITVRTSRQGGAAVIAISDTGGGIPENIRARVFDPFFTTKDVGKGTGQGLAIAWSTVKDRHHGELTFETEVGRGTTFFIRLPIADGATDGAEPPLPT